MSSDESVNNILGTDSEEDTPSRSSDDSTVKILVFTLGDKYYALPAELVKEIVPDTPLYYTPFVPHYIRGLINRLGEPFTVYDLSVLFGGKRLTASTFLVLNSPDDHAAAIITGIVEIMTVPQKDIQPVTDDEEQQYLSGSFRAMGNTISIVDMDMVLQKLKTDIQV